MLECTLVLGIEDLDYRHTQGRSYSVVNSPMCRTSARCQALMRHCGAGRRRRRRCCGAAVQRAHW